MYFYYLIEQHSKFLLHTLKVLYKGCNRRNGPDFGRVFLRSNYTDITQNTYANVAPATLATGGAFSSV